MSGSSAQICSSRSPPDHRSSSRSICGKSGSCCNHSGVRSLRPTLPSSSGPKPMVTVNRDGPSANSCCRSARPPRPCVSRAASWVQARSTPMRSVRRTPSRKPNATYAACACGAVVIPTGGHHERARWPRRRPESRRTPRDQGSARWRFAHQRPTPPRLRRRRPTGQSRAADQEGSAIQRRAVFFCRPCPVTPRPGIASCPPRPTEPRRRSRSCHRSPM